MKELGKEIEYIKWSKVFLTYGTFPAMIDEDIALYALHLVEKKADYGEVRVEITKESTIVLANGIVEAAEFLEKKGIGIRILKNGVMNFSSTNVLDKKNIKEMINVSKIVCVGKKIGLGKEKMENAKWEVKQKLSFPSFEEKIEYLKQLDNLVKDTTHLRFFILNDSLTEKLIINNEGLCISSKIPRISLYYLITVRNGRTEQMNREFGNTGGWECVHEWEVGEKLQWDSMILKKLIKEGKKPPKGKIDFVLAPYITGLIAHESCGHPFEADRILGREAAQAGKSFVKENMRGERIGNEEVNIIDDPTLHKSYGFYAYDDEGVKAKKRYLIKEGFINEFLHNRETAFLMGEKSNASARASSYDREPIVRMANTYIAPGDFSLEELIEDVKKGIYMVTFMEWNIDDKRYQQKYVGEESYLIENGETTSLLLHPSLEITTPKFYSSIDAVGKDFILYPGTCGKGDPMQGIPVGMGGASVRLRNIEVK